MTWQAYQLLAVANLVICAGIAWACICRLNSEISRRYKLARTRYSLLLAGAMACGFQPVLFGDWPTVGTVLLAGGVLAGLAINVVRWHGMPKRRVGDV
jgi:drug/metabolite transporter (DMT)-like permease